METLEKTIDRSIKIIIKNMREVYQNQSVFTWLTKKEQFAAYVLAIQVDY